MASSVHYRPGLRPTLRHLMILCLFVALICAFITLGDPWPQPIPFDDRAMIGLAVLSATSFVLPVLILLLDRPGPARNWYALLIFSTFMIVSMAVATWFLYYSVIRHRPWGLSKCLVYASPLLIVAAFARVIHQFFPAVCPRCGRRSLVPVEAKKRGPLQVLWCACCGVRSSRSGARSGIYSVEPDG